MDDMMTAYVALQEAAAARQEQYGLTTLLFWMLTNLAEDVIAPCDCFM
jgi:hypothetical protein